MFERNVPFDRNVRKLTKTFWFYRQSSEEEAVSSSSASVENKAAPANRYDINYTAKLLACRHFPTMFRSFFSIVLQLVSQQMVHQAVAMAHRALKAPLAPKQMKETLVTVQIAHPMQIKPLVSNTTNRLVFNSLVFFLNIFILSLFQTMRAKIKKKHRLQARWMMIPKNQNMKKMMTKKWKMK